MFKGRKSSKNPETYWHSNEVQVNSEDKFSQNRTSLNQPMDKNAGLLKWKGIVLDAENEDKNNSSVVDSEGETLTVQLQRNWNSRLGFSLSHENGATIISAIHADSVAAKDDRLKINDKLLEINSKNVTSLDTCEIIDMLRTVRGTVTITVHRQNFSKK